MRTKTQVVHEWREGEKGESGRCESHPQVRAGSGLGVSTAEPEVAGGWPECSRQLPEREAF